MTPAQARYDYGAILVGRSAGVVERNTPWLPLVPVLAIAACTTTPMQHATC
jgi:hypothetical protein